MAHGLIDQHLQSRLLIKRFTDAAGRLRYYDLRRHRASVRNYGKAGKGGAFTRYDPAAIERRWGQLESKVGAALLSVDDRSIFQKPHHVHALKHFIALHFFRKPSNRASWESTVRDRLGGSFDRLYAGHEEEMAALVAPYVEDDETVPLRERLVRAFVEHATTAHEFEKLFHELQVDWFERAGLDVRRAGLELFDTRTGLLLSDGGTVPLGKDGRVTDAAFGSVAALVLPIGRFVAASLGPSDARVELADDRVRDLNRNSCETGTAWVYSHPDDYFHAFVGGHRDNAVPAPRTSSTAST